MSNFSSIIVHVPHASLLIPEKERPAFVPEDLEPELLKMTDRYCDELFDCGRPMLKAKVSRLVCDVERFPKDCDEVMASRGMGFAYTRCSDGSVLRLLDPEQKERIFREYYAPHHRALADMVEQTLGRCGRCLIVDGHSFSPVPLPHEDDQSACRPDFCIGTDSFHTPASVSLAAAEYLMGKGFSVELNSPFSSTMVPMEYFGKDARVRSVMIEINRRLYMNPDGEKTAGFALIRDVISGLLDILDAASAK